jgi:hypothetical protein
LTLTTSIYKKMLKNKNIFLFILSLFIGLLLLGIDIFTLQSTKQPLNSKAIAKVNNQYINEDQFLKYAVSLGADFRAEEDQELIDLVLERMIEEELLVQRAIELKLHHQDIQVRKVLIEQIIEFILQLDNSNPSDLELEKFFTDNINRYNSNSDIKIETIFIKSMNQDSAMLGSKYDFQFHQSKFDIIYDHIEKNDFATAQTLFSDPQFMSIPKQFIKLKDCIKYVGPSICKEIKSMQVNSISSPTFYNNGFYIFKMIDIKKQEVTLADFLKFKEQVSFDYKNSKDDQSFIDYIEFLKSRAIITRYDEQ